MKALYEEILAQTDNDVRLQKAEELKNLKEISNKLHEAVSDLHEETNEVWIEQRTTGLPAYSDTVRSSPLTVLGHFFSVPALSL